MSTSKYINRICAVIIVAAIVFTIVFMNGAALGITADDSLSMGYEDTLFDDSYVHTIDITVDDWDSFLENATSEEYVNADVTIDGETVKNVGLRGKGNTSLSTVAQLGSDRYSMKIEFDCYESSANYHGLDKLCLNNLIQDNTMMKDYLAYKLMGEFGVPSPLVSYCFVTVNGEDWGLYLAVEAVEDAFLKRNYGSAYGQLYKPDSTDMGGGRGNGGGFDMKEIDFDELGMENPFEESGADSTATNGEKPALPDTQAFPDTESGRPEPSGDFSGFPNGPGGGMGSDDAKLKYIDDDIDSYSTIFDSAKTAVKSSDEKRLIRSIKSLNEGVESGDADLIEDAVDIDEVMRYMVVHNFLVNGDSYTGSMIHNYYLYEEDGLMSMIPWDYNLAFGTFQASDADAAVNDPIDTPLSVTEDSTDRPMFSWITSTEEFTEAYHDCYQEFLEQFYISGYLTRLINDTSEMIQDFVDCDPTKFCTTEEYEKGVETLLGFVELRCESITGQIDGTIATTDSGQEADSASLIDASALTLSDMGSMGDGNGGGSGGFPGGDFPGGDFPGGDFLGGSPPNGTESGSAGISAEQAITLGVSGVVLLGGLLFAAVFRRQRRLKGSGKR